METIRKGYKQTDIGVIPEDWEVKTIGTVFTSFPTASFSREQLGAGNVKYIHYGDIHTKFGAIVNVDTTDLPTVSDSQSNRYVKLKNGDIILADASEDYEGVGKCIEILNCQNTPAISGLHTIPLRDSNNEFVDGLLGYIFQSKSVKSQLDRQAVGTKVYSISYNSIKECLIPIPTKIEQRAIAEVLSDIDSLIEVLDRKIAKKRAIKDGAMQQLLTAKKRLPHFSEHWIAKRIGDILTISKGQMLTSNDYVDGSIPVIAGGKTPAGFHAYFNRTGDTITISASGASAGFVSFHSYPIFATDCSTICASNNYDMKFIYYMLCLYQEIIYKTQTGGAQPHVHSKDIYPIELLYTDNISEQQAIAQILTDMDDEIEKLEQQRSKYTALKQGAMQQLLTGQIRLVADRQIRQSD